MKTMNFINDKPKGQFFREIMKRKPSHKKHFRSYSNNVVENFKSRILKLEPNSLLEYEKEISFCDYLSDDDSNNFLNEKPKKISDLKKTRNSRRMKFEITNEMEIELDNKIFQKNFALFNNCDNKQKSKMRNNKEQIELMQENFIGLIKQYSDIFQYNSKAKTAFNGKEIFKFENESGTKLNFLDLNLNFQDEFFKLLDEAEHTNTPEDDVNSISNQQDKNKKNCYDKFSNNTSSNSKSFKSLSLNIVGLNKSDFSLLKKYVRYMEKRLELMTYKSEKNENILRYILTNNNISELFKNGIAQNKNNYNLNDNAKQTLNEKDLLDIAEFKINNLEKEIELVKYLIKSKKKTNKAHSINNYKVIKGKDILEQIGVIEETLNEGFNSNYNSTKNVLGFACERESKAESNSNCPAAARFSNDQNFITKETQRINSDLVPFEDTKIPFEFHKEEVSKRNKANNIYISNNCLLPEFISERKAVDTNSMHTSPIRLREEEEMKSINSMKFEEESIDNICEINNENENKNFKMQKKMRFETEAGNLVVGITENFEIVNDLSKINQKEIKTEPVIRENYELNLGNDKKVIPTNTNPNPNNNNISNSFSNNFSKNLKNKFIRRKTILEKNQLLKNLLATKKLFPKNLNKDNVKEKLNDEAPCGKTNKEDEFDRSLCFAISDVFSEKENQKLFENYFKNSKMRFYLLGKLFEKANPNKNRKSHYKNDYEKNNELKYLDFKTEQEAIKRKIQNKNNIMFLIHMSSEVNSRLIGFFYSKKIPIENFEAENLIKQKDKLSFIFNLNEKFIFKASEAAEFHFTTKDEFLFSTGDPEAKEGFLLGNEKLFINYENTNRNYLSSDLSVFGSVYQNENFFDKIDFVEVYQIEFL